ncbi:MAG: cysteine--tRNA ligase [Actinomycetes bacterium]
MTVRIRLHDTLLGRRVNLSPRVPGSVSIYVCGPTVYDAPHLGHGRTAVVFDSIRRYLTWSGLSVMFVSNITDIEDKIIGRAAREGLTESEVARTYEDAYWFEMDRLDVLRPDETPHATQYISEMLELIAELIEKDHAYVIDGQGVYFNVPSYDGYGELSNRRLDDLLEGAGSRVEIDTAKKSPVDFALWKAAKPGEPDWESPWGRGRPGWHIECTAMSLLLLGEAFDIHGGGDDLTFPHHENERAQAEAAGHPFARHWIHSGMVMVGGEKMSKSLGNFTTLGEAIDAHGGRAVRVAVLQTHYRAQTELGPLEIEAAGKAVERLDALARRASANDLPADCSTDTASVEAFTAAMDEDFGTPAALAVVFDAISTANSAIDAGDLFTAGTFAATAFELAGALGVMVRIPERGDDADEIDSLVLQREEARASRDFAGADRIRDELAQRGVVLEDGPSGTQWHR